MIAPFAYRKFVWLLALVASLCGAVLPAHAQNGPWALTVLHFNDFHGQLEPADDRAGDGPSGGIARLAGLVEAIRAAQPQRPIILLFAGDLLQGTVTSTVFLGMPDLELFNAMGVDAAVMGNHELDFGQDHFRKLLANARFPVLAANLRAQPEPFPVKPSVVLHPTGGPRVAVLGLVTEELATTTHPRNARGIGVDDPVATARRLVPALEKEADLVIVLSHLGIAEDRRLAREVAGVDLVVGGHNHNAYEKPVMEDGVPILQAGDRGRYLGRLDLLVKDGHAQVQSYRLLPVDASLPEDPQAAAEVHKLSAMLEKEVMVVIGRSAVDLDARREVIRRAESNFGDWVSDLARELTQADVALFNGGGFRASIGAGEVRAKDVYQAFPFGNELVTGTLTGAQLLAALKRSAALDPQDNPGGFLQVSGVRYVIHDGAAQEVTVGGRPLDPAARYKVVMADFLAEGGDGYAMLKGLGDEVATGRLISDMVMEAFRDKGEISAATDGRIVRR